MDLIKSSFSKLDTVGQGIVAKLSWVWGHVDTCFIMKIYMDLMKKTFHPQIGVITNSYNEVHTGYNSNASSQTFRGGLQALSSVKATSGAN